MADFITALGLVLVIEGVAYALFPDAMKRMMVQILEMPTPTLRTASVTAAVIGVGIVWMVRG